MTRQRAFPIAAAALAAAAWLTCGAPVSRAEVQTLAWARPVSRDLKDPRTKLQFLMRGPAPRGVKVQRGREAAYRTRLEHLSVGDPVPMPPLGGEWSDRGEVIVLRETADGSLRVQRPASFEPPRAYRTVKTTSTLELEGENPHLHQGRFQTFRTVGSLLLSEDGNLLTGELAVHDDFTGDKETGPVVVDERKIAWRRRVPLASRTVDLWRTILRDGPLPVISRAPAGVEASRGPVAGDGQAIALLPSALVSSLVADSVESGPAIPPPMPGVPGLPEPPSLARFRDPATGKYSLSGAAPPEPELELAESDFFEEGFADPGARDEATTPGGEPPSGDADTAPAVDSEAELAELRLYMEETLPSIFSTLRELDSQSMKFSLLSKSSPSKATSMRMQLLQGMTAFERQVDSVKPVGQRLAAAHSKLRELTALQQRLGGAMIRSFRLAGDPSIQKTLEEINGQIELKVEEIQGAFRDLGETAGVKVPELEG